jgi:hypothetical protein
MSFKTTYILFGILAGLFLLLGLAVWLGPSSQSDSTFVLSSMHKRDAVKTDDIDYVEIDRAKPTKEKLVFERDPNTKNWTLTAPAKLRADKHSVDRLVNQVYDARKYEFADLSSNLKDWDLDPPQATVTLGKGDQRWTLNLGRQREGASSGVVYVTSSDDPKDPAAVKRSELDLAFKSVNDFRSKDLLTESALNLQSVKLQEEKKSPVALEKVAERRWKFKEPAGYGLAEYDSDPAGTGASTKGVQDLLNAIEHIRVESDEDFIENQTTDLARYGLESDKPALLRIDIAQRSGSLLGGNEKKEPVSASLLIGKKVEVKSEKKSDEKKPDDKKKADAKDAKKEDQNHHDHKYEGKDKYYARLEGESAVVTVTAKSLEPILKAIEDPASFRNRDLVQDDRMEMSTDAIDIQNSSGQVKLRKPQLNWEVFDAGAGRKTDETTIQGPAGLLAALHSKHQVEFPASVKEVDMGLAKPEATVSLWNDGLDRTAKPPEKKEDKKEEQADKKDEKKNEKKEEIKDPKDTEPKLKSDKPAVKLLFGKRDKIGGKDVVYVRREAGDDTSVVAVPASVLDKVLQKPLAYLDKTLPTFALNGDVTKVVIERGGQTFEIEKELKESAAKETKPLTSHTWKITKPADLAGRPADHFMVSSIINTLRTLRPGRLETEKASEAELEKFGLKSPKLKAVLTVQDKDKKAEEWTYLFGKEEKGEVYAKQGKHDTVFLVSPTVLKPLEDELLDPTVFHFDPSKVKEVKVEGWKKAQGFAVTFDVVRKDSQSWTVKSPPDFDLDDAQVNAFLADLANLRAQRFVVKKGRAKPEHELDEKTRSLQITLTIEGEKAPLTLTLGKLDPNEKAYHAQSSSLPGDVFLLPQFVFERRLSGVKSFSKHPEQAK